MRKMRIPKEGTEEIFEAIMIEFPPINVRHQTTDPVSSKNIKQKTPRTPMPKKKKNPRHIIFKLQIIKDKEKILKEAKGEKKSYFSTFVVYRKNTA